MQKGNRIMKDAKNIHAIQFPPGVRVEPAKTDFAPAPGAEWFHGFAWGIAVALFCVVVFGWVA